jgi:uncharacterized protein (DUF4415 family)
MTDAEIQEAIAKDPDAAPIADETFWKNARVVYPEDRERKQSITLRLDKDVLAWFRSHGPGYQTHMNAVLRSYMKANRTEDDER